MRKGREGGEGQKMVPSFPLPASLFFLLNPVGCMYYIHTGRRAKEREEKKKRTCTTTTTMTFFGPRACSAMWGWVFSPRERTGVLD